MRRAGFTATILTMVFLCILALTSAWNARADWPATTAWTPLVKVRLPIIVLNNPAPPPEPSRLQPADFDYLGPFRLPDDGDRPGTFSYGGNAMTYNPNGNPSGPNDGFHGSLFVMGHERPAPRA